MPRLLRKTSKLIGSIFGSPFVGLWVVMLTYYLGCFYAYPHSEIMRGNLPDPDDYMYLVQVTDWLNGQSWYDNIQHRLNPPDGAVIHFSRIAQFPMAALMLLFEKLGYESRNAAFLMAVVYPILLFAGFFAIMRWVARSFMPQEWAGATAYPIAFSLAILYMFQPGHVDHHGLMVMVTALALGFAIRTMQDPEKPFWALAVGFTLAVGQMLALEILPWVLVIAGWLGLWSIIKGHKEARQGFIFALSLFLSSIFCLLITRPPADFFIVDVLTYSVAYVFLTGSITVCFAGAAVLGKTSAPLRICVTGLLAAGTGFLFLHHFPELIAGPYGGMPSELTDLILEEAGEAIPLATRIPAIPSLLAHLGADLLALAASIYFFTKAARAQKWPWSLILALLTTASGLTIFYQSRFSASMGMLTIIPLTLILRQGSLWAARFKKQEERFWARFGLLLLIGPLLTVILPGFVDGKSIDPEMVLFPGASMESDNCDMSQLVKILNDPDGLGRKPQAIANYTWLGPELLFRTLHSVLAAPYHMDKTGNLDSFLFYSTIDPEEALSIARKRDIGLVVACTAFPESYLHAIKSDRGTPHEYGTHFIEQILGETPPGWLTEIEASNIDNYVIYKVFGPSILAPAGAQSPE